AAGGAAAQVTQSERVASRLPQRTPLEEVACPAMRVAGEGERAGQQDANRIDREEQRRQHHRQVGHDGVKGAWSLVLLEQATGGERQNIKQGCGKPYGDE